MTLNPLHSSKLPPRRSGEANRGNSRERERERERESCGRGSSYQEMDVNISSSSDINTGQLETPS